MEGCVLLHSVTGRIFIVGIVMLNFFTTLALPWGGGCIKIHLSRSPKCIKTRGISSARRSTYSILDGAISVCVCVYQGLVYSLVYQTNQLVDVYIDIEIEQRVKPAYISLKNATTAIMCVI